MTHKDTYVTYEKPTNQRGRDSRPLFNFAKERMVYMENGITLKTTILAAFGTVGAFLSSLFGGWDAALTTLVIFMAIDYVSGLIVAGVFKRSLKSKNGGLESKAGWKGLCKKGMILLIVLIAVRLDMAMGTAFLKDGVVIAYIVNETISIIENAGLMGLPIPDVIRKAIDTLQSKGESDGE